MPEMPQTTRHDSAATDPALGGSFAAGAGDVQAMNGSRAAHKRASNPNGALGSGAQPVIRGGAVAYQWPANKGDRA